ncbi:MAG: ornithine cyclodeaminase [Bacteroidaceae bacterium]|nr:ornithine cyclodeaminase [Bacteroidaceae bacterium]
MKIISQQQIKSLEISPSTCLKWVKESFSIKKDSQLPAKISVHPKGYDFYTAMPCLLPKEYDRVGLKMIHRVKGAVPSLGSDILLYEASTGCLLALMDCDWITAMRTGATAVYAAQTFRRNGDLTYCFVGLGNTARATMLCLLESEPDIMHKVILKKYKDQAELFIERFKSYGNVSFETADEIPEMFSASDVIFSCITDSDGLFCEEVNCFRQGCTLIPVHVRGFQNCDLFFDKVFGDDTDPLRNWKYFDQYRHYAELQDVIDGTDPGRESDAERILSYNYGLALHDVYYASRIYDLLKEEGLEVEIAKERSKFWI